MDIADIEFLRQWLKDAAGMSALVRLEPPLAFQDGRWRPIAGLSVRRGGVLLHLSGRRELMLPLNPRRSFSRSFQHFVEAMLRRYFPGVRVLKLLAGTDRRLHHSAAFVRLLVRQSGRIRGMIWVRPREHEALRERLLAAILLWWDQLLERSEPTSIACFIPDTWSRGVVAGLSHLRLPLQCFRYPRAAPGPPERIFPASPGASAVHLPYVLFPGAESAPPQLKKLKEDCQELQLRRRAVGWELAFKGLPVAWTEGNSDGVRFNIARPQYLLHTAPLQRHLDQVMKLRNFPSPDPTHPFYTLRPERWLEHEVLRNHRRLDSEFGSQVYAQVPTYVGGERKVLDLLTCTHQGRLAVVELKAHQDLCLIFQALEYWVRVGLHLQRGDFQEMGYFEGCRLRLEPPLLYLVCPLFQFHRVLPQLRRHLTSDVSFRCVGVNSDWRCGLKVLRRFEF